MSIRHAIKVAPATPLGAKYSFKSPYSAPTELRYGKVIETINISP
jgi:hypothetical protein